MCGVSDEMKGVVRRIGAETGIIVGVFAIASLVAALIWNAVADLPLMIQLGSGKSTIVFGSLIQQQEVSDAAVQAMKVVRIDATYLFVSAPIALLLGAGLAYWRRRTPVTTVVLIALISVCAAALMERFGLWIGPANPIDVLKAAKVGASASAQLKVQATGVLLVWPAAALLGALAVLLVAPARTFEQEPDPVHEIGSEPVGAAN